MPDDKKNNKNKEPDAADMTKVFTDLFNSFKNKQ